MLINCPTCQAELQHLKTQQFPLYVIRSFGCSKKEHFILNFQQKPQQESIPVDLSFFIKDHFFFFNFLSNEFKIFQKLRAPTRSDKLAYVWNPIAILPNSNLPEMLNFLDINFQSNSFDPKKLKSLISFQ